ncbi:MAG: MBOAT family protein [Planctomycetes bacterium]|nr:MBOAT family protein [Planctomycetota bacterium]
MIFSSFIFLFWYLPLFLGVYWLLPLRGKNLFLTLTSYVFYGWWRPDFVLLMLFSTAVDYTAARCMGPVDSGTRRKRWLVLSMVTNLGLLAYYKYANLLVSSWNDLAPALGVSPIEGWAAIILPVGISFYTFQSMSYTIDVYWGQVKPVRSFLDLACYVSMFPQLVAGPIVRYRDVLEQLVTRTHTVRQTTTGIYLFAIGVAKKVLIADAVAPLADAGFALSEPTLIESWIAITAYATQIYFDFSGYSDMAIGLGLMTGFAFPINFLSPYKSKSITEFWRRWHISLSTWLRDYLYIPLGGNQKGELRTYVNLMTTMLLGGLWHGASWTFLLWGAYQGIWLVIERPFRKNPLWSWMPQSVHFVPAFVTVLFGWVLFRATSMANLGAMWSGMVGLHGFGSPLRLELYELEAYVMLVTGLSLAFFARDSWSMAVRFRPLTVLLVMALFLVAIGKLMATKYSPFLYFQF